MEGTDRNRWGPWETCGLALLNIITIAAVASLFFITGDVIGLIFAASFFLVPATICTDAQCLGLFARDFRKRSLYALGFLASIVGGALTILALMLLFSHLLPIVLPASVAILGFELGFILLVIGAMSPFLISDHFAQLKHNILFRMRSTRQNEIARPVPVTQNSKHSLNSGAKTSNQTTRSWSLLSIWQATHRSEDTNSAQPQP